MNVLLSAGVLLVLASSPEDQPPAPATRPSPTTMPAPRPAGVATSRPFRADARLSPARIRRYRLALAALAKEGNSSIQAARLKLQDDKKKRDEKYQQQQAKSRDLAMKAARQEMRDLQRRRPNWSAAGAESRKAQAAQQDMKSAEERHKKETDDYNRAMIELNRLQKAWTACREYALDLDYSQLHEADLARKRAEDNLTKRPGQSDPDHIRKLIEPIEKSIHEELRKLENRDEGVGR